MQKLFSFVVMGMALQLSGCSTSSSKKDYGNSMQSVGGKAQELGDRWAEGGDLIEEGNKLIKQSQLDRVKGENMVKKGLQIQAESEKIFKETYQRVYQNAPNKQEELNRPEFAR
ncbi:MAG: hypothetical protein PHQ03_07880 [Methylococcales bacterium]|nr:hypothetical protein [Methylococcales bacterium]